MPNRVDASQRHVHGVQKVTQQPREKEKAHDHEVGALILDRARDGENGEKNCRVELQRNDLNAVRGKPTREDPGPGSHVINPHRKSHQHKVPDHRRCVGVKRPDVCVAEDLREQNVQRGLNPL